jgi:site-specific recombinase XerD
MTRPTTAESVGDLSSLLDGFITHLRAAHKSPRTIEVYGDSARLLINFLRASGMPTTATSITREHVEAFISDQLEHHKPATASVRYMSLVRWFRWLLDEGEITRNPMERMEPPTVPETPVPLLSDDQLRALLSACSGQVFEARRDTALIRLFLDTGCRLGEIANLRLENLDLPQQTALVTGKGRRQRNVSFGSKTAVALDRYLQLRRRRPEDASLPWVWVGRQGRMTEGGIRQVIRRRGEQAGIDGLHPHAFRHQFAHGWLADGGQEGDLMRLAGWRSRAMLSRTALALPTRGLGWHIRSTAQVIGCEPDPTEVAPS